MKRSYVFLLILISMIGIYGCTSSREKSGDLKLLRISVLPDESREKLLQRYSPFFDYLAREIGIPYELVVPDSYNHLLELFHNKQIDLAYFGGFTFVKAQKVDNAVPLVMREVDTRFISYFLVKADSPLNSIADFKGKPFTFGSDLSTSGHLMPRYFLKEMGIVPEAFFSQVGYSGKHDLTAYRVRDGQAELGVANHAVINKMFEDGRLSKNEVRVLWETPPYPDYIWALQPQVDKALALKIRDAFLGLSMANKEQAAILHNMDTNYFLPASIDDFSRLNAIITELNLLGQHVE